MEDNEKERLAIHVADLINTFNTANNANITGEAYLNKKDDSVIRIYATAPDAKVGVDVVLPIANVYTAAFEKEFSEVLGLYWNEKDTLSCSCCGAHGEAEAPKEKTQEEIDMENTFKQLMSLLEQQSGDNHEGHS